MGKELTLILGGGPRSGAAASTGKAVAGDIKLEPASGEEGVFYSQGGDRYFKENFYCGRGRGGFSRGAGCTLNDKPYDRNFPRENKNDKKGKITKCRTCGSTYHYQNGCEVFKVMKNKNTKDEEANLVMGDEEKWTEMFLESLDEEDRLKVVGPTPSDKVFKFGNNGKLISLGQYIVPVTLAGKRGTLKFDKIKSDIPLLLCKKAMKTAKVKLNIETDTVKVFGEEIDLATTSSGHYLLPLLGKGSFGEIDWDTGCSV